MEKCEDTPPTLGETKIAKPGHYPARDDHESSLVYNRTIIATSTKADIDSDLHPEVKQTLCIHKAAKDILGNHPIKECCHWPISGPYSNTHDGVQICLDNSDEPYLRNVSLCKSHKVCIVCAEKERRKRWLKTKLAVNTHLEKGKGLLFITLTQRHTPDKDLKYLFDQHTRARNRFIRNGSVKRLLGIPVTKIFKCDVCFADRSIRNPGCHVHSHILLFVDPITDDHLIHLEGVLKKHWSTACQAEGLEASPEHGLDVRRGDKDVANYLFKPLCGKGSVGGQVDQREGKSIFDLIAMASDLPHKSWAANLVREFDRVTYQKHLVYFSPEINRLYQDWITDLRTLSHEEDFEDDDEEDFVDDDEEDFVDDEIEYDIDLVFPPHPASGTTGVSPVGDPAPFPPSPDIHEDEEKTPTPAVPHDLTDLPPPITEPPASKHHRLYQNYDKPSHCKNLILTFRGNTYRSLRTAEEDRLPTLLTLIKQHHYHEADLLIDEIGGCVEWHIDRKDTRIARTA